MHSKAKSLWAVFVALLMAVALFAMPAQAASEPELTADTSTFDSWQDYLTDDDGNYTTENIGRIWTDKTVSATDFTFTQGPLANTEIKKGTSDFLVALSSLSSTSNLTSTTTTPLDIVLVLDVSGSMGDEMTSYNYTATYSPSSWGNSYYINVNGSWRQVQYEDNYYNGRWYYGRGYNRTYVTPKTSAEDTTSNSYTFYTRSLAFSTTKLAAMKSAVNAFIDTTATQNATIEDETAKHRIALVQFASSSSVVSGLSTDADDLQSKVNDLRANGATYADYGMNSAVDALDNARDEAKKIVVLFTDGEPNHQNGFWGNVAASAVNTAKDLKDAGALIYTVGVFSGANPEDTTQNFNVYMHGVSSNYPEASATSYGSGTSSWWDCTLGDRAADSDYYKAATSSDELESIFNDIANEVIEGVGVPTQTTTTGGFNTNNSGYITFTDTLGDYMQVDDFKSIVYNNEVYGNPSKSDPVDVTNDEDEVIGSKVTYTFTATVKANHPNESTETNLSYIQITVTRSSDLKIGDIVEVKIPAALIPLREFNVDTDAKTMHVSEAYPIRIFYGVSVKPGVLEDTADADAAINNPDADLKAYIAANTENDQVKFYSNKYTGTKGDEGENGDTTAAFTPAESNQFYYFAGNTYVYSDAECTQQVKSTDTLSKDETLYYYQRTYYKADGSATTENGAEATTETKVYSFPGENFDLGFSNFAYDSDGNLYIAPKAHRVSTIYDMKKAKTGNETNTAANVINPIFDNSNEGGPVTVYLGNNGLLKANLPGTLSISKTVVPADTSLTPDANATFTFQVNLTDANGSALTGSYQYKVVDKDGNEVAITNNTISNDGTLTLKNGQTATIYGLEAGTQYAVMEQNLPAGFTQTAATGASGTITSNTNATAAFTNTYSAEPVTLTGSTNLPVQKVLSGREWREDDTFTFKISSTTTTTPADPLPESDTITITNNSTVGSDVYTRTAFFGDITFTRPGTYTYTILEQTPSNAADKLLGITYSDAAYNARIVVEDNKQGKLKIKSVNLYKTSDDEGNVYDEGDIQEVSIASFTNAYSVQTAGTSLLASKALNGGPSLTNYQFSFLLEAEEDNAPMPAGATGKSFTVTNVGSSISFGQINFTDAMVGQTFHYTLSEVIPTGAVDNTLNGITYDTKKYTAEITVGTVEKDGELYLVATPVYKNADGNEVSEREVTFTNTYKAKEVTLTGNTALGGTKTLTGRDMGSDEFNFTLTPDKDNPDGATIASNTASVTGGKNGEAVSFAFGDVTFTSAGTYTFYIEEVEGDLAGVTYDTHTCTVTVVVTDDLKGQLAANVTYSDGGNAFTNTYGASGSLNGGKGLTITKTLNGRGTTKAEFSYIVTDEKSELVVFDKDGKITDNQAGSTVSGSWDSADDGVAREATILSNLSFTEADVGKTFTYTVEEAIPEKSADDITYDRSKYTITINVKDDDKDGELEVTHQITRNDEEVDNIAFINVYGTNSKTVNKTAEAQVGDVLTYTINWVNNAQHEGEPCAAKMTITDSVPTGTDFVEVSDGGTYDADSKMVTWTFEAAAATSGSVQFKVRINEDAKTLIENKANIQIGENGPAVDTNTVTTDLSDPASLTISKTVETVDGQNTTVDTNKEFTFKVTLVDSAGNELAGAYSIQGTDKTFTSGGTVTLKHGESATIENLPAGTYYTVTETDIPAGYTAGAATQTGTIGEDSTAAFFNTYKLNGVPTTATINAHKVLTYFSEENAEEMALQDKQFSFELVDAEGNTVKSAENDANGNISFEMEYTQIGTYNYTIREVNNNLGGIEYDGNTYGVTVTVSDKGDGTIRAVVEYLTEDKQEPTFRNNYRADINPDAPAAQVSLEITKNLTGRDMKDGEFSFSVLDKDGNTVSTGTNDSNGVVKFAPFGFGVTDSEFNDMVNPEEPEQPAETPVEQPETPAEDENNTEDEASETTPVPSEEPTVTPEEPTVTPEETPGETESTEDAPEEEPSEEAEATPTPSEQPTEPVETTEPEATGEPEAPAVTEETERTAHARTDWTDQKLKELIGDHWYSIVENGVDGNGVTYDKTVYYVKVTVNDNGNGALVVSAPAYYTEKDNEKISINAVAFENTYAAAPAEITLQAGKQLLGRGLQEGEFTFQLSENGAVVAEAVNNANGSILFDMTYDTVGEHTYTVTEKAGDVHQIDYDAASFEVKVSVTDNGMGQLVAAATYPETILFTNSYTPDAVQVTLEAAKKLEGRAMEAGEFLFRVTDADGNELATGRNDADGKVRFSAITFTQAGSYVLTLREEAGSAEYVTYDDKAYQVTVRVTDEDGRLVAAVEQPENGVTFTNKYEEPVPEPTPTATPAPSDNNDNTPDPTATPAPTPAALIPQTGDEMPIGLLCALLAISAAALVALVVVRKRRGGKE